MPYEEKNLVNSSLLGTILLCYEEKSSLICVTKENFFSMCRRISLFMKKNSLELPVSTARLCCYDTRILVVYKDFFGISLGYTQISTCNKENFSVIALDSALEPHICGAFEHY